MRANPLSTATRWIAVTIVAADQPERRTGELRTQPMNKPSVPRNSRLMMASGATASRKPIAIRKPTPGEVPDRRDHE